MTRTTVTRTISAPVEKVFRVISTPQGFCDAVPDLTGVEFLSDVRAGVGTRFREFRRIKGKDVPNDLEITEFEENRKVRMVADSHGTVWDSIFTVTEAPGGTELRLVMDARPHTLMARLTVLLTRGIVKRAVESDMDSVKTYCEE